MRKLAIIGNPVEHSRSPQMHEFISGIRGTDLSYEKVKVESLELSGWMKNHARSLDGFNVTAPHKTEVMKYLDEVSPDAEKYGAVNTVVNKSGRLFGYNTDADGFYMSLIRERANIEGADILVLGAGGAAKPSVIKLAESGVGTITVLNRTRERAEELKKQVYKICGFEIDTVPKLKKYDIAVNCTPLGMGKNVGINPLSQMDLINEDTLVYDMIYNPWETELLKEAKKRGAKTANGLGMLVYQGILAHELFCSVKLPEDMAQRIFKEVFSV